MFRKGAAVRTSTSVTAGVTTPALTYAGDDSNNTSAQAFDLKYSAVGNLYSRFNLVLRRRDLNWARSEKYCT